MAAKHKNKYPPKKKIIQAVEEEGFFSKAAYKLGFHENSLRAYVNNQGWWPEIEKARQKVNGNPKNLPPIEEVNEVHTLKQRIKELESTIKRAHTDKVMEERIALRLEDVAPVVSPKYKPLAFTGKEDKDEHEFILLFSDTHAGEVVDSEQTLGMNEYNWQIMLDRMAKLQKSVLSYQDNRPYKVKKLHIAMLGDMLSGDIHDELTQTNELPHEESVVQFGADGASFIEEFVPYFESINVVGVVGNHPRRTKKPAAKLAQNNSDWVTYKFMQAILSKYETITWDFPRSTFATMTVAQRWRLLLMHGDGIRSTMPGVPWGGVTRRITTLEQQFSNAKQPLDYVALGHFHTANALDGVGVKTFMNGSLKGVDEYSMKQFGSGRKPTQLLLTFHPKNGITDVSYIDLEPVLPAGEGHNETEV